MLDKINLSKKNYYGGGSGFNEFEELIDEFKFSELRNIETDKQIKQLGFAIAKYAIINWDNLIITKNPEEIITPEVIWILSPKTAHPKAATLMKEEWWWNSIDDFSPFGNDDGSDAFYIFKDWRVSNLQVDPAIFILELEKRWGMSFSHINKDSEGNLLEIEKANGFYRNVDRAIIGITFGQLVLEGNISPILKELGIKVIKRTRTEFGMKGMPKENKIEYTKRLNKMEDVLNKF